MWPRGIRFNLFSTSIRRSWVRIPLKSFLNFACWFLWWFWEAKWKSWLFSNMRLVHSDKKLTAIFWEFLMVFEPCEILWNIPGIFKDPTWSCRVFKIFRILWSPLRSFPNTLYPLRSCRVLKILKDLMEPYKFLETPINSLKIFWNSLKILNILKESNKKTWI